MSEYEDDEISLEEAREKYKNLPWDKLRKRREETEQDLEVLAEECYSWDREVDALASDKSKEDVIYEDQENETEDEPSDSNRKNMEVNVELYLQPKVKEVGEMLELGDEEDIFLKWGEEGYEGELLRNVTKKIYGDELGNHSDWDELEVPERHSEVIATGKKLEGKVSSISEAHEKAEGIEYSLSRFGKILRECAPQLHESLRSESWEERNEKNIKKYIAELDDELMNNSTKPIDVSRQDNAVETPGHSYDLRTTEEIAEKERGMKRS